MTEEARHWEGQHGGRWGRRRPHPQGLPGTLLATKPPDETQRGGALLLLEDARALGEKEGLVREIPPPFTTDQEAIRDRVVRGEGCLLERLGCAAEETAPVGQVLASPRQRELRSELIPCIPCSAGNSDWRGRLPEAVNHVVRFSTQGYLAGDVPGGIRVQDV